MISNGRMPSFRGNDIWTYMLLINCCILIITSKECNYNDFDTILLPCNADTRTRSYITHQIRNCNTTLPGSVKPKSQTGLPCECSAGQGLALQVNDTFSCQSCPAGHFSSGGELISNFRNWNGKFNLSGSGYDIAVSCGDPFAKNPCQSWRPGGNYDYLVSGEIANSTNVVSPNCYSHAIMDAKRIFVTEENSISFSYQVDAKLCSRKYNYCASGLYFFIDGKEILHSDFQFAWKNVVYNLTKGAHQFKWVFRRSCSRVASLNVAYLKHLSFVGTLNSLPRCGICPAGTFSTGEGKKECVECPAGQYQNVTGMTQCIPCPEGKYSRVGDKECYPLPSCDRHNYALTPDPVDMCYKKGDSVWRKQKVELVQIPGSHESVCIKNSSITFPDAIPCQCRAGYYLDTKSTKIQCLKCPQRQFSNGSLTACDTCPSGHASIPGLHFTDWSSKNLPELLESECSGDNCNGDGWIQSGSFIRTTRIAGNFETKLQITNLTLDYFDASITFYCSVYCNVGENRSARSKNCYMRTIIMKGDKIIRDKDCVSYNIMTARNGTIMKHTMKLSSQGNYSFRWLFHHGDDSNNTNVSYEGRLYNISIVGSSIGSASSCSICPSGSFLPEAGIKCEPCRPGTFSGKGASECTPCTNNTFSDTSGSKQCKPCGTGTFVNSTLTGCDLRGCKYSPSGGITYDFMPLARDGGAMREVKHPGGKGASWYKTHYYVNLCTKNHDNSSCYVSKRQRDDTGKWHVIGQDLLSAYACKRWSFTNHYSYSLGSTMGFQRRTDPRSGVDILLSDGYNCYSQHVRKIVKATTKIEMVCDLEAGEGYPGPVSNDTSFQPRPCEFHMVWHSMYACPICQDGDYIEMRSACVNGKVNVTQIPSFACRPKDPTKGAFKVTKFEDCKESDNDSINHRVEEKTKSLMAIVIACVVISCILCAVVAFILCKNRRLRRQLFTFHPSMKELQGETDYQELVADT